MQRRLCTQEGALRARLGSLRETQRPRALSGFTFQTTGTVKELGIRKCMTILINSEHKIKLILYYAFYQTDLFSFNSNDYMR